MEPTLGLLLACSMLAAFTGCFMNLYSYHCVSEIEKLKINIHIDILMTHIQRVHSWPAVCLQRTCNVPAAHLQVAQGG